MDARNSAGVSARIAVVGLVTAALLGGCDGGEGSSASSSSSSSSSAGVSGSATSSSVPSSTSSTSSSSSATAYVPVKPQFPAEAKKHTDAGAVAFVKYYWAAVDYAWTKPDERVLVPLSLSTCKSCAWFEKIAADSRAASEYMSGPAMQAKDVEHVSTAGQSIRLACKVTQFATTTYSKDGTVVTSTERDEINESVDVVWSNERWQVGEIGTI